VTPELLPIVKVFDSEKGYKYSLDKPVASLTVEDYSQLLSGIEDGSVKPFLKSAPIPESNDGPVVEVVGQNFKEVVMDQSKNVFVKFYAPWCGHCKKLAPVWEQLAEAYASNPEVVIARLDSTENEVEEVQIQGFPTLYFFPKGSSDPIPYEGEREFDALKEFVEGKVKDITLV